MIPFPRSEKDDILLWQDGFWCFREELTAEFLRDDNYQVILCNSDEWLEILTKNKATPPPRKTEMSKDAAVIQQVDNEQAVIDQLITMELCRYVAQELGYEGFAKF